MPLKAPLTRRFASTSPTRGEVNNLSKLSEADFYDFFKNEGGFASVHWNGDPAIEAKIKNDLNITIRCIPLLENPIAGKCIFTGEPSQQRVIFAKSY
jgi:prolyl-tRNA synthetase